MSVAFTVISCDLGGGAIDSPNELLQIEERKIINANSLMSIFPRSDNSSAEGRGFRDPLEPNG